MPNYVFREGPLQVINKKAANAQKLGEAADAIYQRIEHRNYVPGTSKETPRFLKALHDDAVERGAESPFHAHLLWDDNKAGNLYRLGQLRNLLGMIRVVSEETGEEQRAFVSIKAEGDASPRYRSAEDIVNSLDLQIATLRRAERDLAGFEARYRDLADLCEGARRLRELAQQKREALMAQTAAERGVAA